MKRNKRVLVWTPVILFVVVCAGTIGIVAYNLSHPMRSVLVNGHILDNAQKIYQKPWDSDFGPGNDSEVIAIFRLAPGKAQTALSMSQILPKCITNPKHCSNPTWQPWNNFISKGGTRYDITDVAAYSKSVQVLYQNITGDSTTRCSAYDITYGESSFQNRPNSNLVCINARTNILIYEYISDGDSTKWQM